MHTGNAWHKQNHRRKQYSNQNIGPVFDTPLYFQIRITA